jgi:hypothetical protein
VQAWAGRRRSERQATTRGRQAAKYQAEQKASSKLRHLFPERSQRKGASPSPSPSAASAPSLRAPSTPANAASVAARRASRAPSEPTARHKWAQHSPTTEVQPAQRPRSRPRTELAAALPPVQVQHDAKSADAQGSAAGTPLAFRPISPNAYKPASPCAQTPFNNRLFSRAASEQASYASSDTGEELPDVVKLNSVEAYDRSAQHGIPSLVSKLVSNSDVPVRGAFAQMSPERRRALAQGGAKRETVPEQQRTRSATSTASGASSEAPVPSIAALAALRSEVFGCDAVFETPFGPRAMVYADYAASGRLLRPMEAWLSAEVYPWFANVHSEVGQCARVTGKYVQDARAAVAAFCGAPRADYAVIFAGAGVTGAAAKLAHLLGIHPRVATGRAPWTQASKGPASAAEQPCPDGSRPVVIVSLMEHHSNVVFWREMDCDLIVCLCATALHAASTLASSEPSALRLLHHRMKSSTRWFRRCRYSIVNCKEFVSSALRLLHHRMKSSLLAGSGAVVTLS